MATANLDIAYKAKCVVLVSGKRKSGKDYISEMIAENLKLVGISSVVLRVAAPIKLHWAQENDLDYEKLLGSCMYKEIHRKAMLNWGVEQRTKDYGIFCREAIRMYKAEDIPVWIIADARYTTDFQWFTERFSKISHTVRVIANDTVRQSRGWIFTHGVDDDPSECAMDGFNKWDFVIRNDGDHLEVEKGLGRVVDWVHQTVNDKIPKS